MRTIYQLTAQIAKITIAYRLYKCFTTIPVPTTTACMHASENEYPRFVTLRLWVHCDPRLDSSLYACNKAITMAWGWGGGSSPSSRLGKEFYIFEVRYPLLRYNLKSPRAAEQRIVRLCWSASGPCRWQALPGIAYNHGGTRTIRKVPDTASVRV